MDFIPLYRYMEGFVDSGRARLASAR